MTEERLRLRFAPSPTGHLHLGGARTALFNWLLARHTGGTFILRIEDTDRSRSTEEYEAAILEAMRWLGLDWDEGPEVGGSRGPYRQTERTDLYRAAADRLLREGKAYRCTCSAEELDARRKEAEARKVPFRYDGRCREKGEVPGRPFALRLRIPDEGTVVVDDLLRGRVEFPNRDLDDWILLRSDGTPTYNFCVVVDDVGMGITDVLRGDDHLSNTPKQVHLFRALGHSLPRFAHVPMILGSDRTRLSKRHAATAVLAYRDEGYLPEAVVNYLARLSWSAGDQEIFTREELVAKFSLEGTGKSAAVFNPEKLKWVNAEKMRALSPEALGERLLPHLERRGWKPPDRAWIGRLAVAMQERAQTLGEIADAAAFCFAEPERDARAAAKWLVPSVAPALRDLLAGLEAATGWEEAAVKPLFESTLARHGLKMAALAQAVRVALTGKDVSPPIYDVLWLLGRERSLARLRRALDAIEAPTP
ncbi:MAG TPA: glutamate--tRNA ligase [Planctomycetota bacterium]|jgi:glutamyl-tRNA synthetase|nr:glutamate--tRNA ligase [Planctomycetota bacterium]